MFGKKKHRPENDGWTLFSNGKRVYDSEVAKVVKETLTKKQRKDTDLVVAVAIETLSTLGNMSRTDD